MTTLRRRRSSRPAPRPLLYMSCLSNSRSNDSGRVGSVLFLGCCVSVAVTIFPASWIDGQEERIERQQNEWEYKNDFPDVLLCTNLSCILNLTYNLCAHIDFPALLSLAIKIVSSMSPWRTRLTYSISRGPRQSQTRQPGLNPICCWVGFYTPTCT